MAVRTIQTRADVFLDMLASARDDACLLWPYAKTGSGRPVVWFEGKNEKCHRLAFRLSHGHDAGELMVRHKCDTPACFNPHHLEVGTVLDNAQDRVTRGRGAKGGRHGRAKITEVQAAEIRASIGPAVHLAPRYGISNVMFANIRKGRNWKVAS